MNDELLENGHLQDYEGDGKITISGYLGVTVTLTSLLNCFKIVPSEGL
jgi:hypothetical protein